MHINKPTINLCFVRYLEKKENQAAILQKETGTKNIFKDVGSLEINRIQLIVQYFSFVTEKPVSKGALNFCDLEEEKVAPLVQWKRGEETPWSQ